MSEWAPAAAGGRSASARGSVASATSSSPWDLADADAGAESDDWVRQKHVREAATAPPRHQSSLPHSRGRHQSAGRAHGPDLTAAGWRGGGASDSQPWSGGTRSHAESERHSGAPTDEASGNWQQVPARRNSTRHRHDGHRRRPTTWTPSEAFLNAAAFGNTERVKYFMSKAGGSIDPSTRDAGGTPALHNAVDHGHEDTARALLVGGADPNQPDECKGRCGRTTLHALVWSKNLSTTVEQRSMLRLLLRRGADPTLGDAMGVTPLANASRLGKIAVVADLLNAGACPDARSIHLGRTPVHDAASNGHEQVLQLLLDAGVMSLDYEDNHGFTAAGLAARWGHSGTLRMLIAAGADLSPSGGRDRWNAQSPLDLAVKYGHAECERVLAAAMDGHVDRVAGLTLHGSSGERGAANNTSGDICDDNTPSEYSGPTIHRENEFPSMDPTTGGTVPAVSTTNVQPVYPASSYMFESSRDSSAINSSRASPPTRAAQPVAGALHSHVWRRESASARDFQVEPTNAISHEGSRSEASTSASIAAIDCDRQAMTTPVGISGSGSHAFNASHMDRIAERAAEILAEKMAQSVALGGAAAATESPSHANARVEPPHAYAAAASGSHSAATTFGTAPNTGQERNEKSASDEHLCVVCLDSPRCTLLLPCKHLCLCKGCASSVLAPKDATGNQQRRNLCPLCQSPVVEVMDVFV